MAHTHTRDEVPQAKLPFERRTPWDGFPQAPPTGRPVSGRLGKISLSFVLYLVSARSPDNLELYKFISRALSDGVSEWHRSATLNSKEAILVTRTSREARRMEV